MSEQMTIGTDLGTFDSAEVLRGEEIRRLRAALEKREAQVSALEARIEDMNYDLAEARSEASDATEDALNMENDHRLAKAREGRLKAHVSSALRILDAAAEAAREVPDGYALREAVLCAVEALRGE